ncbi:LPS export ABC transporter periplasmic protein LptC [Thermodesulfobacteriota bacterium]
MIKNPIKYLPIAGIIVLLAVIGFLLIKSGHERFKDSTLTDIFSEEGLKLKNIHYIQNNPDEGTKWVLDAEEVKFSKDRQHISFNNFRLKLEPENKPFIEMKGNRGEYDKNSHVIELRGDLRGYTENGYRITTEQILYKQKEGFIKTDEPVKITGPFFSVVGRGLRLNLERETLTVISDATTLIERGSFIL